MKTRISELIGATNLESRDKDALEDHARYLLSNLVTTWSRGGHNAFVSGGENHVTT